MFCDYVSQNRSQHPNVLIASFNPWFYEDTGALVTSFFATIAAELEKKDEKDDKRARTKLKTMFGFLTKGHKKKESSPWKEAARALKGMGVFLTAASKGISLFGINVDAGIMKDAVQASAGHFKQVGEFSSGLVGLAELADGGQKKLEQHRGTVEKALRLMGASGGRIVILLDDVDRLNKTELLSLLRLVRTVADLPYVTLIVAMDDERIRDVLSKAVSEGYGHGYLDKIIQVPMHIPLPDRKTITDELVAQLDKTFQAKGINLPEALTSSEYYQPEELRRLVSLIRTPRDLARYINGVRTLLLAGNDPDIHPTDAALIEALHIFYPDVYDRVRRHKEFLTKPDAPGRISSDEDYDQQLADRAKELDLLIHGGPPPLETKAKEPLRGLLNLLFQNITSPGAHQDRKADASDRRIRSPVSFDNYFRYSPPSGALLRSEMDELFRQILTHAKEDNTSGIAESLATAFIGRDEQIETQIVQELGHRLRKASPQSLERFGEGVIATTKRLSPDLIRELLVTALQAAMRPPPFGSEDEWTPGTATALTQKFLQMAMASLPITQLAHLLNLHGDSLEMKDFQQVAVDWIQRINKELCEGDPLGGSDAFEWLNMLHYAMKMIRKIGTVSPVSLDVFRLNFVKYVVRIPERLPQALLSVASIPQNRPPTLQSPNRSQEDLLQSLQHTFGDYKLLQPAYEAFCKRNFDAGRYKQLVDEFGKLL